MRFSIGSSPPDNKHCPAFLLQIISFNFPRRNKSSSALILSSQNCGRPSNITKSNLILIYLCFTQMSLKRRTSLMLGSLFSRQSAIPLLSPLAAKWRTFHPVIKDVDYIYSWFLELYSETNRTQRQVHYSKYDITIIRLWLLQVLRHLY